MTFQPPTPRAPRKNRGCLITALVLLAVVILFIAVVVGIAVSGPAVGGKHAGATPDAKGSHAAAGVGDAVRDGKFTFVVVSTTTRASVGNSMLGKYAQGKYLVVKIKVKNHGSEPQGLTDTAQELYGPGGRKYAADSEAAIYANQHNEVLYNDINPGNSVTGVLMFDVPKTFKPSRIVLHDSAFSGGAAVNLQGA